MTPYEQMWLQMYGVLPGAGMPGGPNPINGQLPGGPNPFIGTLPGQPNPTQPYPGGAYPQPPGPTPTPTGPIPVPGNPPPINRIYPRGFSGNNSNPWMNQFVGYRNPSPGLYGSELSRQAGELDPRSEFTRIANQAGGGGMDRRGSFMQNQFNAFDNAFNARQLENPGLTLRDFITQSGGARNLKNQWQRATQSQRGLNAASRSGVIGWG